MFARKIDPTLKRKKERIVITVKFWKSVKHSLRFSILYNSEINLRSESSVNDVRTSENNVEEFFYH